jgi:hypothetical protein
MTRKCSFQSERLHHFIQVASKAGVRGRCCWGLCQHFYQTTVYVCLRDHRRREWKILKLDSLQV